MKQSINNNTLLSGKSQSKELIVKPPLDEDIRTVPEYYPQNKYNKQTKQQPEASSILEILHIHKPPNFPDLPVFFLHQVLSLPLILDWRFLFFLPFLNHTLSFFQWIYKLRIQMQVEKALGVAGDFLISSLLHHSAFVNDVDVVSLGQ